ncbi:MAG: hypothetical protein LH614_06960 [Pyrinomonadaceae bacterium]|nr:hypothetical protein [Pyrinomonadaceae bacterium]
MTQKYLVKIIKEMKITYKYAIKLIVFLFLATTAFALKAEAAVYIVTNTNNDGAGSLREAIGAANSTSAADTINFNILGCENGGCTILLTGTRAALQVNGAGSLTIANRPGASNITIAGNPTSIVFFIYSADLTFDGITIANGNTAQDPDPLTAGEVNIYNGTVRFLNSLIRNNTGKYGGIYNNGGTLIVTNSVIRNNNGQDSGGLRNGTGQATLTNSIIQDNTAVFVGGGSTNLGDLTLNNSIVQGNYSQNGGGGVSNAGNLYMTSSTIRANRADTAGGGIQSNGNVAMQHSSVSGNFGSPGGGIYNERDLKVSSSLIDGNQFGTSYTNFVGSGIHNGPTATATITNTTISNNIQPLWGGGS